MVSIIIPVYNVEKYINNCIKSVVNQTFTDFEVILIDDGSTDSSGMKCHEWEKKDSRIRLIQKDNEGLGPTRNLGVQLAKYDYITFLDSDDWWDIHYLEEMMLPILKHNVDVVCCDIHYWEQDVNGNITDNISELRIPSDKILIAPENKELINTARTFMWGKIYKKKLFIDNNIIQPAHAYEDVPTTPLIIAKAERIYRICAPLYYYYRKRTGSLANNAGLLWDMKKSIEELIANFKRENIFEIYQKQLKKLVYSQVRFIFNKAQVLCDEKTKCEIEKSFLELMTGYFPELMSMGDEFYIIGNEDIERVMELIVLDKKQIVRTKSENNNKSVPIRGNVIIDLANINSAYEYECIRREIDEVMDFFKDSVRVNAIIILVTETFNKWQNKFYKYIEKNIVAKKVRINISSRAIQMDEKQLWNLADEIFYEM